MQSRMKELEKILADTKKLLCGTGVQIDENHQNNLGVSPPRVPKIYSYILSPPSDEGIQGVGLKIKIFNQRLCHQHLLWHLMFKGCTVLEWLILYKHLEGLKIWERNLDACACLFGVLSQSSSTRERLDHMTSRTRPIHKWLRSIEFPEDQHGVFGKSLLDFVLRTLSVPKKGLPISELYQHEIFRFDNPTPIPISRMGVGYKDKGSMGPDREEIPDLDDELIISNSFDTKTLVCRWRELQAPPTV